MSSSLRWPGRPVSPDTGSKGFLAVLIPLYYPKMDESQPCDENCSFGWMSHYYGSQLGVAPGPALPLHLLSALPIGQWSELPAVTAAAQSSTASSTLTQSAPNLGLWWYLGQLMFEPFLEYFRLIVPLLLLLWTSILGKLWLRDRPEFLLWAITGVVAVFRFSPVSYFRVCFAFFPSFLFGLGEHHCARPQPPVLSHWMILFFRRTSEIWPSGPFCSPCTRGLCLPVRFLPRRLYPDLRVSSRPPPPALRVVTGFSPKGCPLCRCCRPFCSVPG